MVNFTVSSSLFKYSWDQVAIALWQRYPNPNSKHVLTEDVISRHVEGNKLITKRLLTKTNKIPKWGERLLGEQKRIYLIEESVVDLDNSTFKTYTRNISLQHIMTIEEKCVYKTNPETESSTVCERSAFFTSPLQYIIRKPIELFTVKRFRKNGEKASLGLDFILNSIYNPDSLKTHPLFVAANSLKETAKDTARKAGERAKETAKDTAQKASEMAKAKAPSLQRVAAAASHVPK